MEGRPSHQGLSPHFRPGGKRRPVWGWGPEDLSDVASPPGWSLGERGPAAAPEEGAKITRCGCARDCSAGGDPLCGSNGVVYTSACHLQEAACLGRARLEPAPPSHCALGEDPPWVWPPGPQLPMDIVHRPIFSIGPITSSPSLPPPLPHHRLPPV